MSQAKDVVIPAGVWTLLTNPADGSLTAARLQNLSESGLRIQARAGVGTDGLSTEGALMLRAGEIIFASDTFASLFPGVSSPNHLFGFAALGGVVSVNHA